MTPLQEQIFREVNEVEEMSENAFLMAWDDYFKGEYAIKNDIIKFKSWLFLK